MVIADFEPLLVGTDKIYPIRVTSGGIPVDVSTWTLNFMVKQKLTFPDSRAVITKSNGVGLSVSGAFSVDPNVTQQTVYVTIAAADSLAIRPADDYEAELKRMDTNFEAVLLQGLFPIRAAVHKT